MGPQNLGKHPATRQETIFYIHRHCRGIMQAPQNPQRNPSWTPFPLRLKPFSYVFPSPFSHPPAPLIFLVMMGAGHLNKGREGGEVSNRIDRSMSPQSGGWLAALLGGSSGWLRGGRVWPAVIVFGGPVGDTGTTLIPTMGGSNFWPRLFR